MRQIPGQRLQSAKSLREFMCLIYLLSRINETFFWIPLGRGIPLVAFVLQVMPREQGFWLFAGYQSFLCGSANADAVRTKVISIHSRGNLISIKREGAKNITQYSNIHQPFFFSDS